MRTATKNCPASQGNESRRGGGGTPTGTTTDASTDNINGSKKGEKSLLCMGNPSGPAGHLPCKAEEFCLRTDKLFAAIDFKSVAAYQRGSMKPFFPTEFRLSRYNFPKKRIFNNKKSFAFPQKTSYRPHTPYAPSNCLEGRFSHPVSRHHYKSSSHPHNSN